jgi:hypothetical protein
MLEDLEREWDGGDGLDWLIPFAQDVRFASCGPVPMPNPELAALIEGGGPGSGVSNDKGDLLVTAASNVHGPAPQAAGLPNWRKEIPMPTTLLSALLAKIAGAGTVVKAAIATTTAFATMTVAGAAAGVLPGPVQGVVGGAINAVSPLNVPTGDPADTVAAATDIVNNVVGSLPTDLPTSPLGADVTVQTPAGPISAGTSSNLGLPEIPQVSIPNISIPNLPLPQLPDINGVVASLPVQLPDCVKNLLPSSGAMPNPTALVAQIPACIQTVLATTSLPVNVSSCVAAVLGTVTGVLNPASIGSLPQLDVSACAPLDVSHCTTNVLAAANVTNVPFVGDMLGHIFGGSAASLLNGFNLAVPGLDAIPAGCVPIDVAACLTSLTSSLGTLPTTGGVPSVNLSACMPTGLTSGIPGIGSGIAGLSGLPFLPFGNH